jgi:hypothetical protein
VLRAVAVALRAAIVVVGVASLVVVGGVGDHPAPTLAADEDAPREFPDPVGVGRRFCIALDGFASSVHPLAGNPRVQNWDRYPLLSGLWFQVARLIHPSRAPERTDHEALDLPTPAPSVVIARAAKTPDPAFHKILPARLLTH